MSETLKHTPEGAQDFKAPETEKNLELEESMEQMNKMIIGADVIERSENVPGALVVLAEIAKKFPDIKDYYDIASKLGTGNDIWKKYKDECNEDYGILIEKYGTKQ